MKGGYYTANVLCHLERDAPSLGRLLQQSALQPDWRPAALGAQSMVQQSYIHMTGSFLEVNVIRAVAKEWLSRHCLHWHN